MLNVYLIRHGQTAWNADGNRYCGRTDIPLTKQGVKQAEIVANQLKKVKFNAVYSSPLMRAYQTAKIASNSFNIITDERLIEVDFGKWEGKTKEEFIPENELLWQNWSNNPNHTRAGGTGETALQVIIRMDSFFSYLITQYESANVLVAGHNGINRLYLAYKLGMPLKNYRKLVQENATITLLNFDSFGELTLVRLNSRI